MPQDNNRVPEDKSAASPKKPRSWGVWAGGVVAILLVAAGIYLFGGFGGDAIRPQHRSALEQAMEESARLRAQEDAFRVAVDPEDLSVAPGLPADWRNILLLGTDMGGEQTTHGRTDAMLILSVHEETGALKLTSLIRDMLVPIPGATRGDKLNTANAYGGPLLAVKTVNEMLNINIDRYCLVDFQGFMEVVNLLGGADIELTEAEAREVGLEKIEGPQHLTGWQTLTFARIRRLDNNFGRNERQRKVLDALLQKARGQDINTLMGTVAQGFEYLATNLSTQEVLELLTSALKNQESLEMLSLPPDGKYRYEQTPGGSSAIGFNTDTVRNAFYEFVYGTQTPFEATQAPDTGE